MMTPYYDEAGITIYHGDCRDVLPPLGLVDLVLTDPPYGNATDYDEHDDTPHGLEQIIAATMPLMRQVARVVVLTPGIANVHRYPPPTWLLAWVQAHGSGTGKWGFNEWQPVLVYGTDPYLSAGKGRRPDVIRSRIGGGALVKERAAIAHPCPKPLDFWTRLLIRCSPDPTDTILDPFMGSGTTLRAAKDLGRRAIGVDISERYCEVAARRLGQGVLDFGGVA
jgi:DNA modification methylase